MAENKKKNSNALSSIESGFEWFGNVVMRSGELIWGGMKDFRRFHKILLAIPVAIAAVWLAISTAAKLPEYVGINMLETGEFAYVVTREIAVLGPLAVTALCLLLMFCSRRTVYPWLISIFSLVLPLLLLVTNLYPA